MNYKEITDFYKEKFGKYAGWAHSYLFAFELPIFKEVSQKPDLSQDTKKSLN